jgi:hypothetical protein
MALIRCTECRKKVSTKATQCPSCGAPVVLRSGVVSSGGGCLIIAIATCVLWLGMKAALDGPGITPQPTVTRSSSEYQAPNLKLIKRKMPHSIDATGIGLYGILKSGVPLGIRMEDIRLLGNSWDAWSQTASDQLSLLYDSDSLDIAGQEASLGRLRQKVNTLRKASSDSKYRSIIAPLTTVHARLNRRVTLAESILDTMNFGQITRAVWRKPDLKSLSQSTNLKNGSAATSPAEAHG